MKAEFLIENIEKFLPLFSKILPLHSQIPVLSNLLVEVDKTGMYVSTTNLELAVKVKIAAKVETEGATTVPGKQFIEAISSFSKDKVSLVLDKDKLILSSRGSRISFQTIAKEEFPTLFEEKGEKIYVFEADELKNIFSKVIFATAMDEARPELTGILLAQNDEEISLVATDGFRLALKKLTNKKILEGDEHIILPARIVSEAMSLAGSVSTYVYKKSNQIIFETENITLIGRLISGDFPNYERVIPKSNKTVADVDREEFLQKIKLSSVFAKEAANIVRIKVASTGIKIFSSASSLGEGEVSVDAEVSGEENEIAFNVRFLNDFLKNISSKAVTMELSSGVEPALFKIAEDPNFIHIIMPVRVQE